MPALHITYFITCFYINASFAYYVFYDVVYIDASFAYYVFYYVFYIDASFAYYALYDVFYINARVINEHFVTRSDKRERICQFGQSEFLMPRESAIKELYFDIRYLQNLKSIPNDVIAELALRTKWL